MENQERGSEDKFALPPNEVTSQFIVENDDLMRLEEEGEITLTRSGVSPESGELVLLVDQGPGTEARARVKKVNGNVIVLEKINE